MIKMRLLKKEVVISSAIVFYALLHAAVNAEPMAPLPGFLPAIGSYMGNDSEGKITAVGIQSDGKIVLGGMFGSESYGVNATSVAGATATSSGAIVRLNNQGTQVESVTRVGDLVSDLSIDPGDNSIYVATMAGGLVKLSADGGAMLWKENPSDGNVNKVARVDVGSGGTIVVLVSSNGDIPLDAAPGSGLIVTYDKNSNELGRRSGHHNTLDVCVDDNSQTAISVGWRQTNAWYGNKNQPVQISHIYGHGLSGSMEVKWKNYDWSTDRDASDFLNKPTNNMADTRGKVCAIGKDGMLYCGYEAAGGNHIFRYDPHDIMVKVGDKLKKPDLYSDFYKSASEHKCVYAKYNPSNGDVVYVGQLCGRSLVTLEEMNNDKRKWEQRFLHATSVFIKSITADKNGQVYLGGSAAYGLPIPSPKFNPEERTQLKASWIVGGWTPDTEWEYTGGAWLMVVPPDFGRRKFITRPAISATTYAVDAKVRDGLHPVIVMAGTKKNDSEPAYTKNPIQADRSSGTHSGYLTIFNTTNTQNVSLQRNRVLQSYAGIAFLPNGIRVAQKQVKSVALYSLEGKMLNRFLAPIPDQTFTLDYPTGMYIIRVTGRNSITTVPYTIVR